MDTISINSMSAWIPDLFSASCLWHLSDESGFRLGKLEPIAGALQGSQISSPKHFCQKVTH